MTRTTPTAVEDIWEEIPLVRHLPALVEGPNDRRALERLGFTRVLTLAGPLYQVVERLQHEEEVLLLTDLDAHGRGLYKQFYTELTKRGVKINNKLRMLIFQTEVRQIEGLESYLRREGTHRH